MADETGSAAALSQTGIDETGKKPSSIQTVDTTKAEAAVAGLIGLMARLQDPQAGCPWDIAETFASIAPYTI